MSVSRAVILPLGFLFEKVDTDSFIVKMLTKAKQANRDFEFTPAIKMQAFQLSEKYNRNEVSTKDFREELLKLLGVTMSEDEFRTEWNAMIKVGEVGKKIHELQQLKDEHKFLLYLISDTNVEHLLKIEQDCPDLFKLDSKSSSGFQFFADNILYASCYLDKNRADLLKQAVDEIGVKSFNTPSEIKIILGDAKNIVNKDQREIIERENDGIAKWATTIESVKVQVVLHSKLSSLTETLTNVFKPVGAAQEQWRRPTMA